MTMDNYEVNVLTRKGGWKRLPQEIVGDKDEMKLNSSENLSINTSENLNINVTDEILDDHQSKRYLDHLFRQLQSVFYLVFARYILLIHLF